MERCILCGRKISNTRYNFGLGCLKKMCNRVNIYCETTRFRGTHPQALPVLVGRVLIMLKT